MKFLNVRSIITTFAVAATSSVLICLIYDMVLRAVFTWVNELFVATNITMNRQIEVAIEYSVLAAIIVPILAVAIILVINVYIRRINSKSIKAN